MSHCVFCLDALGHRNKILRSVKMLREKQDSMSSIPIPSNLPGLPVDIPHEYYCPITHEVMTDPVICAGQICVPSFGTPLFSGELGGVQNQRISGNSVRFDAIRSSRRTSNNRRIRTLAFKKYG